MSNALTSKEVQLNLNAAERFNVELDNAADQARALLALRQWQLAVEENRQAAHDFERKTRLKLEDLRAQENRRAAAETQICEIEEEIAQLKHRLSDAQENQAYRMFIRLMQIKIELEEGKLSEAQAERNEAEASERELYDSAFEYERRLEEVRFSIKEAEEGAARAKEAIDGDPMMLMKRLLAQLSLASS